MLALSVTVYEIFTVEISTTLTLTFRIFKGEIKGQNATSYVLAIAMFVQTVAVCEAITYKLLKVLHSNL